MRMQAPAVSETAAGYGPEMTVECQAVGRALARQAVPEEEMTLAKTAKDRQGEKGDSNTLTRKLRKLNLWFLLAGLAILARESSGNRAEARPTDVSANRSHPRRSPPPASSQSSCCSSAPSSATEFRHAPPRIPRRCSTSL